MQAFAGYFRVNTGRVQFLQMPVILLTLYCKRLTLYCKCLRCDRWLFTVDGVLATVKVNAYSALRALDLRN
ncbi:hypothetical protein QUA54_05000 [Microcoleus sp. MOSTC5]